MIMMRGFSKPAQRYLDGETVDDDDVPDRALADQFRQLVNRYAKGLAEPTDALARKVMRRMRRRHKAAR